MIIVICRGVNKIRKMNIKFKEVIEILCIVYYNSYINSSKVLSCHTGLKRMKYIRGSRVRIRGECDEEENRSMRQRVE